MRQFLPVTLAFMLLVFQLAIFADVTEPPKFSARLRLTITADEAISAQVTSYITREIRALGDVTVADDNPDWEMHIIAMQMVGKDKTVYGIALSAVLLQRSLLGPSLEVIKNWDVKLEDAQQKYLNVMVAAAMKTFTLVNYKLRTGPPESLQDICAAIVAEFDAKQLEPERKRWQSVIDLLDNKKP